MDTKLARMTRNVHHLADSFQAFAAEVLPVIATISAISIWKKRNKAERETNMSHGWDVVVEFEIDSELACVAVVWMVAPI